MKYLDDDPKHEVLGLSIVHMRDLKRIVQNMNDIGGTHDIHDYIKTLIALRDQLNVDIEVGIEVSKQDRNDS